LKLIKYAYELNVSKFSETGIF